MRQSKLEVQFVRQRGGSISRNIEFELTFEEWLKIWVDSGHLHERGRKRGQYCMARFNDKGPYAVGNVKIITNIENNQERKHSPEGLERLRQAVLNNINCICWTKGRKISDETKEKLRKHNLGKEHSAEAREKVSKSLIGNKRRLGTKDSEATKEKKRVAQINRWKKERLNV